MFEDNIMLLTDSYKFSHWKQYPPGTQKVYSYFESRGGKFDATLFFGLQYFIKRYLMGKVVTAAKLKEAAEIVAAHMGPNVFNVDGWVHILNDHDGHLPLKIMGVPEGTLVPTRNVLMTVENTCPKCFWLTNYVETLLVQTWYPTTVATLSWNMKKLIGEFLDKTGDPSLIDFKLHDFGFRGVSSVESAGLGGLAHLANFKGTDTVQSLVFARNYYGEEMAGFSIPAAEHSTITSWGKSGETEAYANMLERYPTGLVAVVSDSYDIYNAVNNIWGGTLKKHVLGRNGCVVVRPDSGDPSVVLPRILKGLAETLGAKRNSKGYYVLDPHVRVIQGDGINFESTREILETVERAGLSADNLAFGMGGGLLQNLNRDTQKFAFKCSQVVVDSVKRDVWKEPVTDPGKTSKKGELKLVQGSEGLVTVPKMDDENDLLQIVFWDGDLYTETNLKEVRNRANKSTLVGV